MKLNVTLGSFAIVILLSACGVHPADDSGSADRDGGGGNANGYHGGSTEDGPPDAGTPDTGNPSDAGTPQGDGQSDAGAAETSGHVDAGAPQGGGDKDAGSSGTTEHGDAGTAKNDDQGEAGAPDSGHGEAGATDSDDNAGAPGDSAGGTGRSGGASSTGGSGGLAANGGSGDVSSTGGYGGLAATGGSGDTSSTGGSGGLAANGGAGDVSSAGGSGGLAASGGSGDTSSTGGSGGLAASGGTGNVSSTGGSAGLSNSAGAGGSSGNDSLDPQYLFTTATFGGNGRTCTTCHTAQTGTISPAEIQALYSSNPSDPIFRSIDSDDGAGDDYSELQAHATFRVSINLPAGVTLASDPNATSVVFRRGTPTTINTPSLDTVFMWDGREPDLEHQAADAILGHAQGTVTPTADQLQLIVQFEQGPDFFSSDLLRNYADNGGPQPTWPAGNTDSEQRGRRWFAQDSSAPRFNVCGQCHGGPMANTTQSNSGLPAGKRFQTVNVSEFNEAGNPTYQFTFPDPTHPGKTVTITSPDPGRALITGDPRDANFFKIPSLWGIKNTAPYFHDNSANTLDELMAHYKKHLATFLPSSGDYPRPHVPTDQDVADIIAYLNLL